MITGITITDPNNTCVEWWPTVGWLKGVKELTFKPGVNVILGPNGSGKSTVLTALARTLMCEQGGTQKVTYEAISEVGNGKKTGLRVQHDGSPVVYSDPNKAFGLVGGMAGFDDDFFELGLQNCMYKGSAGQTTITRLNDALHFLVGLKPVPAVKWNTHNENLQWVKDLIGQTPEKPIPTIIFDEPTRCLEMKLDAGFWANLVKHSEKTGAQVIVAAHSPFCINIPGVHYIETKKEYRLECLFSLLETFAPESLK